MFVNSNNISNQFLRISSLFCTVVLVYGFTTGQVETEVLP